MKIPRILETLALKIAAAIFPRAIETITTEEETVDGKAARKNIPIPVKVRKYSGKINLKSVIVSGKRRNVDS
jgi:hypothetical protein